ncbi:hypothetical protein [Ralstonia solanacearum]|uniref:hypothetical protein n=1 Tax=Ralstonia solanacearum TaxID=305 RepID=UPI0010720B4D|nr:hypothetical protein [Ralstonia solanacearum]
MPGTEATAVGNVRCAESPAGPPMAMFRQKNAAISCRREISGQDYIESPHLQISKKISQATLIVANIRI